MARSSSRPSLARKLATIGSLAVALVAVAGAGAAIWDHAAPAERGVMCIGGGGQGPRSQDPEIAFEEYWAQIYPDDPLGPGTPVERDGTTWHVREGTPDWIRVTVGHDLLEDGSSDELWRVTGASHCHYSEMQPV